MVLAEPLRRHLAAVALLLVAGAASGSSGAPAADFRADEAHGTGTFEAAVREGVVQAPPPAEAWTIAAAEARITLVDDWRNHEVEHPLRPGDLLYSEARHAPRSWTVRDARITVQSHGEANATLLLLPHRQPLALQAKLPQGFDLKAASSDVLERSHFVGDDAVFAEAWDYEIALAREVSGPAVQLVAPSTGLSIDGPVRLYLWGADLGIEAQGATERYRTGYWRETAAAGMHGESHYVYAFLNLTGARLEAEARGARIFATSLRLGGDGSIAYMGATGTLPTVAGPANAANATLVAAAGEYDVGPQGSGLGVVTRKAPTVGPAGLQVRVADPLGAWWPWLVAVALGTAGALYAAPYAKGRSLRRKGRVVRTASPRGLRTEGFSHWASRAETQGYRRLAALLAGRAVRNSPLDGDAHMEYAIRLQRVGRWGKALLEHEAASQLYGVAPDGGHASLNAYHAAVASTRLGRASDALYWLQHAVEGDPGWATAAHRDPALARLRDHQDFQAITGSFRPMR